MGMLILVDSREQKPYWVGSQCAKTALNVGDYTTAHLLGKFHIERKSPGDLYGTLVGGHNRWRREVFRAKEFNIKLIVLTETTRERFINKDWPGGQKLLFKTESLDKMITTYETKYAIEFVWVKTRKAGMEMVLKRLQKEERNPKYK